MQILHDWVIPPHECPYLPDRVALTRYQLAEGLTGEDYEALMDEEFRKFGRVLFRPVCRGCQECRPVRVPVEEFSPDRSQRRAWRRNEHLEVRVSAPGVDDERLDLYHRYHAYQAEQKGWPEQQRLPMEYAFSFVENDLPGVEITLWEQGRLRAVILTEVTPRVVSAVYHYYDPELARQSVGTCSILHTIELARRLERRWVYLGYYVADSRSMAYKARFQPCEILGTDGVWRRCEGMGDGGTG